MQLIGTIIVFLIGVVVGIALHASGYLTSLPEYFPVQSSAYQDPAYSANQSTATPPYPTNDSYATNQSSSQVDQSAPYSQAEPNYGGSAYEQNSAAGGTLRLTVRCNVQPEEMPYGCGAAYTLVNRTPRSLYVTFEGGDTQFERANSPMTIAPGQSLGGNTSLEDINASGNSDDLTTPPPFVIEIQD